ncbi:4'-phosphopantetheinyl transferase family protein [Streptomyces sp. NPDC058052]|uniref:4'-phosphopantetheinyl transferase family protein n=1 Tax=Streptomyces sp. NPDC058052 TaxID=3346316 RepID=UPI0036E13282
MTPPPPPEPRHRRIPSAAGPVDLWWRLEPAAAGPGRGRDLLRHAVAARSGRTADDVLLAPDPVGRPRPLPGQDLPPSPLTAAHCGPLVVAALITPTPRTGHKVPSAPETTPLDGTTLGIDVEHLSALPSPALLRHALRPAERAALNARPAAGRCAAFLALWTAKEAVAKAVGWPLLRALVDVEIALDPHPAVARLGGDRAPRGWHLVPLRLSGLPHTVTLALHHPHPAPERENPWISPAGPRSSPEAPAASAWPSPTPSTATAPRS